MITETGTGIVNANSYVTLDEALEYWDTALDIEWPELSDDDQERNLVLATRYLDRRFGSQWIGKKKLEAQGLDWPRTYHILGMQPGIQYDLNYSNINPLRDSNGFILEGKVPFRLKLATFELAKRVISSDKLYPDVPAAPVISERVAVGTISTSTTYANVNYVDVSRVVPAEIQDLLGDLILQGTMSNVIRF